MRSAGCGASGAAPMGEVHRLYRDLRLRQYGDYFAARGRPGLAALLRLRPVLAIAWRLHVAATTVREVMRQRATHADLGLFRTLRETLNFALEYRVKPDCYFRYRLYENWHSRDDYIYDDELWVISPLVCEHLCPQDTAVLADKIAFTERCAGAGLPVVPILAVFRDGAMERRVDAPVETDLFSKFSDQHSGDGARLWRYEDGRYLGDVGAVDLEGLRADLAAQSRAHPVLLQPRLRNHVNLLPVAGQGLSTVRMVTVRAADGEYRAALALLRMAVGSEVADNFDRGGVAAPIDLACGVLGTGAYKRARSVDERASVHPETQAPIEGRKLPFWAQTRDLAVRAHGLFPTMPSIGWDIAITDAGPVLVEGNSRWALEVAQRAHRAPLGRSRLLAECFADSLRAALAREAAG